MIVRSFLIIPMAMILQLKFQQVYGNTSVLERYEQRLNSALSKKHGAGHKTIKRYKCVEEYVTYDHRGKTIEARQGPKYTTTMEPPVNVYRTASGDRDRVRDVRRKPPKKVTIAINRENEENLMITTPMTPPPIPTMMMSEAVMKKAERAKTTTTTSKPFDEMDDEEADRIIEEMYLKKKEGHTSDSTALVLPPQEPSPPIVESPPLPPPSNTYSTDTKSVDLVLPPPPSTPSSVPLPLIPRYNSNPIRPQKTNSIESDRDEDYSQLYGSRNLRKRPFEREYDDYDDFAYYRPLRRELHNHRRRPMLYTEDINEDRDFDNRFNVDSRHQMTRDLSPLRSMKRLRPYPRTEPSLPSASLQGIPSLQQQQQPQPLPLPSSNQQQNLRPQQFQNPVPLQSAPSTGPNLSTIGGEALKMKPLEQSNPQEMQEANAESCAKITKLAKNFGIKDVSTWARSNCQFLQMYAPMASCELIFHFIDSCKKQKFL